MSTGDRSGDRAGFNLQFALDSEDPEFLRGCEVGSVNAKMRILGEVTLHELMLQSNREMLRRMAEAAGRHYNIELIDDTYMAVTIYPGSSKA